MASSDILLPNIALLFEMSGSVGRYVVVWVDTFNSFFSAGEAFDDESLTKRWQERTTHSGT